LNVSFRFHCVSYALPDVRTRIDARGQVLVQHFAFVDGLVEGLGVVGLGRRVVNGIGLVDTLRAVVIYARFTIARSNEAVPVV